MHKNEMHKHIRKHIDKSLFKGAYNIRKHLYNTNHTMFHIWELALVVVVWLSSLLFASTSNLPNNTSFSYPLKQVSTLECRTLYWNDMPDSCKINLPIIHWANYSAYENNSLYKSIYTALRAAPYSDSWNQKIWAHAWVDIATARGTPLYSIWDWEIYFAWWNSAYGNVVKIKYIYNWEMVYAIYAHMDSIDLKTWDKVSKSQKIWTVWNSWNTSWWLWWYHVHFEIDKDSFWRPAYSYANCPDLSKWHYKIIQNWLCRTELFTYQYDPIRLLESNSTYVFPKEDNNPQEQKPEVNKPEVNNPQEQNPEVNKPEVNKPVDSWNNNIYQDMKDTVWWNDTEFDKWNGLINNSNNNHSSSDTPNNNSNNNVNNWDSNQNTLPSKPNIEVSPSPVEEKDTFIIDLDFSWLKYLAEHFSRLWDVEMKSELKETSLMLWETKIIEVEIFKKWKDKERIGNYYNWVLQTPFVLLSNNDIIKTDINSLQLISKWKAKIEITWNKVWKSTLIIKLDDKKIWYLDIIVK